MKQTIKKIDKLLTKEQAYNFMLQHKIDGCEIILDWDGYLAKKKPIIKWIRFIINTYKDLNEDLIKSGDTEYAVNNEQTVMLPLKQLLNDIYGGTINDIH